MRRHRTTPETRAVLRDLLHRWDDTHEVADEWLDLYGAEAVRPFARQLRADLVTSYADCDDPLLDALLAVSLRRVDWTAVAAGLLACAARQRLRDRARDVLNLLRERGRRLP